MIISDSNRSSARRFQFGLRTFLLVALALGPILAWVTIKLGFATPNCSVMGRVTQDGMPAAQVTVTVISADRSFTAKTTTDAQGNFVFKGGLPEGMYMVAFDDPAGVISPRYRTSSASGLMFAAQSDAIQINFDLRSGP